MRYLYVYDPDEREFVDFRDITNCSLDEREMLRLEMMSATRFPLEVLDSLEDGFPSSASFGACLAASQHRYICNSN